ncbi:MAG: hypothetical protein IJ317_04825, partial [Clostridia bacterium]|nr:hypothetical protein [Clostridia bacterium]
FRKNSLITYSLAAGLEQAMDYLLNWRFDEDDIEYLRSLKLFDEDFLAYLKAMRLTGDVYAVRKPPTRAYTARAPRSSAVVRPRQTSLRGKSSTCPLQARWRTVGSWTTPPNTTPLKRTRTLTSTTVCCWWILTTLCAAACPTPSRCLRNCAKKGTRPRVSV